MDTRWFRDFVTLAEVRNFTRAAEIRNVSQAAFSRRIQALEQAKLIDCTAFPTRLTDAGERFRTVAVGLSTARREHRIQSTTDEVAYTGFERFDSVPERERAVVLAVG